MDQDVLVVRKLPCCRGHGGAGRDLPPIPAGMPLMTPLFTRNRRADWTPLPPKVQWQEDSSHPAPRPHSAHLVPGPYHSAPGHSPPPSPILFSPSSCGYDSQRNSICSVAMAATVSSTSVQSSHPADSRRERKTSASIYSVYGVEPTKVPRMLLNAVSKSKKRPRTASQQSLRETIPADQRLDTTRHSLTISSKFSPPDIRETTIKEQTEMPLSVPPPRPLRSSLRRKHYSPSQAPGTPNSTGPQPLTESTPPPTPSSPGFQPPSEEEQCRRRIAKLTRTLGEHVPTELVFPARKTKAIHQANIFPDPPDERSHSKTEKTSKHARRTSLTLASFASLASVAASFRSAHSRDSSGETTYSDREQPSRPVSATLTPAAFSTPVPPLSPPNIIIPSPPGFSLIIDDGESESTHENGTTTDSSPATPSTAHSPLTHSQSEIRHSTHHRRHNPRLPRPDTPFIDSAARIDAGLLAPPRFGTGEVGEDISSASRKERRQGWSGEWNRRDMQDVIQRLRVLK